MMKIIFWGLMMVVFALSVVGAASPQQTAPAGPPQVVKDLVAKARDSIQKVSATEVKMMIDKKDKVIYLDVRDGGEFSAGHLPGAINISRGTLEFNVFHKIQDQNARIIVYCKTTNRSALATKTLNDLGYKNAILMDGHFQDWIEAGYPVER